MPRTTARKTAPGAPRKRAAKKVAASKPPETVESYKKRVAEEIKHYTETGELCAGERDRLRETLDLDEHLGEVFAFKLSWSDANEVAITGDDKLDARGSEKRNLIAKAIGDAFSKMLAEGIDVTVVQHHYNPRKGASERVETPLHVKFLEVPDLTDYTANSDPDNLDSV